MSKENLAEVKRQFFELGELSISGFEYLVTQAEEKIQLEERVEKLKAENLILESERDNELLSNQRYKQALEEIVKEGTLKIFATGKLGYKNGAKIARQALQGGNDNE